MDIKHRQMFAGVKASGVGKEELFEGSFIVVSAKITQWLLNQNVRKDNSGSINIVIRVSDSRFEADPFNPFEGYDSETQEAMRRLTADSEMETRDIASLTPPWLKTTDGQTWMSLKIRSNYNRAVPDEIEGVRTRLIAEFSGQTFQGEHGLVRFDDWIIDKNKF